MATGPTSPKGKQKVSGNALKHGLRAQKWLTPDEKRDFEALARDLTAKHPPATDGLFDFVLRKHGSFAPFNLFRTEVKSGHQRYMEGIFLGGE